MRKALLTASLTVAVALMGAGTAAAKQTPVQVAYGEATYSQGVGNDVDVSFAAQRVGAGPRATGFFDFRVPSIGYRLAGDVTALRLAGNIAYICGVVTDSSDPDVVGEPLLFSVQDNGPSGAGDLIAPGFLGSFWGPNICELTPTPDIPIDRGDFAVTQCDKFKDKPHQDKNRCKNKQARPSGQDQTGGLR